MFAFMILVAFSTFSEAAFAAAEPSKVRCPGVHPKVTVKPTTEKLKYDYRYTAQQLTKLAYGHRTPELGTAVLGTGGGDMGMLWEYKFKPTQTREGMCFAIQSMTVELVAKPVITIAKDYKKGSCEWNAIVEHEQKHIRELYDFQHKHIDKIEKDVTNLIAEAGPYPKPATSLKGVQYAQAAMEKKINARMGQYYQSMLVAYHQAQANVDTPHEYERVAKLCKNW